LAKKIDFVIAKLAEEKKKYFRKERKDSKNNSKGS
jgi:hypothetical protein